MESNLEFGGNKGNNSQIINTSVGCCLKIRKSKFNEVKFPVSFGSSLFMNGFPVVLRELSLVKRILLFDR